MKQKTSLFGLPSAWIPIAMSAAAFLLVVSYIALFGITKQTQADEGVPARLFQLLIAAQIPIIAYFVFAWISKKPKQALTILGIQLLAAASAVSLVFFLEL